jgi:glutathione S-transferase
MSNLPDVEKPRFVYWSVNARALTPMLMLEAAGIEYTWDSDTANTWPKPKDSMPFGQLPVFYHNDMCIAQSGTITRYCAKLAGLTSLNNKENVISDMLQEHCNDIYNDFGKAKYCPDVPEIKAKYGWESVRNTNLPSKLNYLEKMLANKSYFNGDQLQWGDICVFSMVEICSQANLFDCFENFPNLKSHYARVSKYGGIQNYFKIPKNPYFIAE